MTKQEILQRLKELFDIDGQVIYDAMQAACERRQSYEGQGYPKMMPGLVFWAELVQCVCEAVIAKDDSKWKRGDIQNKPYLLSESLKRIIFFASAEDVTVGADPKVKNLGKVTERMIKINPSKQRDLFVTEESYPKKSVMDSWKDQEMRVWALLYEVHPESMTVDCEISQPIWQPDVSECYWEVRYTLPPFAYQESTQRIPETEMQPKTIEVEVGRKSDMGSASDDVLNVQNE